jgi:hypothetical protein
MVVNKTELSRLTALQVMQDAAVIPVKDWLVSKPLPAKCQKR